MHSRAYGAQAIRGRNDACEIRAEGGMDGRAGEGQGNAQIALIYTRGKHCPCAANARAGNVAVAYIYILCIYISTLDGYASILEH